MNTMHMDTWRAMPEYDNVGRSYWVGILIALRKHVRHYPMKDGAMHRMENMKYCATYDD